VTPTFIRAVGWEPKRTARARALATEAGAEIVWDFERKATATFLTACALADGPSIHLEDDVALTSRWREKAEKCISEHPADVVQMFSMTATESHTAPGRTFLMTQCVYLPDSTALFLWAHQMRALGRRPQEPDLVIADWLVNTGRDYWCSVPSLVQHEEWHSTISPYRSLTRRSVSFEP